MTDYIDRKKLLEDLERFAPECRAAFLIIEKQEAVDAVPAAHGRWESFYLFCDFNGNRVYEHHHLECGFRQRNWAEHLDYNYCPNCGARMDLEV